jgi:hypothetical protein
MGFNTEAFAAAEFTARTESVDIAQLAEFFAPGELPTFVVRGLTANELQRAMDAGAKQGAIDTVVKAIASQKEQVAQIRKALGMAADVPGEVAKRMEMLVQGCVAPPLNHAAVAKLAEVCPIEFYDLTNKITLMTGQGGSRVKPPPSSQTTEA